MKLGPYGQLHREQLQQSRPEMYGELQKSGELGRYLREVDQSADRIAGWAVPSLRWVRDHPGR